MLSGLTALSELKLDHAEVTDASAKTIAGLKSLKSVDLFHTLFTEPAIKSLNTAMPGCRIYWERDSNKRERRS